MRRSARGEQSSAFSLFPFLAVLLCTMGALVVLLVAMAHVSRDKAEHEAEIAEQEQRALATPDAKIAQARFDQAKLYEKTFEEQREKVEEQLSAEQQKLTGIEDHIRRMRSEAESLRAEAIEIIALEETHVDDHEVAKLELERLNEFAETLSEENAELAQLTAERQRRYAIVPLREGTDGTRRPAIYFECREDGVTLQPEGIEFPRSDFAPPAHVSSPLAAAIRTVQQFYINNPETRADGEEGAPYPLIVVRPGGVIAYQRVTQVLESIDSDYGYQPVADDWAIEYESPNPQMAEEVFLAIELARQDRLRLSSAAPQLFRQPGGGWGNVDHDLFERASRGNATKGSQNPFAGVSFDPSAIAGNFEPTSNQAGTGRQNGAGQASAVQSGSYGQSSSYSNMPYGELGQNGEPGQSTETAGEYDSSANQFQNNLGSGEFNESPESDYAKSDFSKNDSANETQGPNFSSVSGQSTGTKGYAVNEEFSSAGSESDEQLTDVESQSKSGSEIAQQGGASAAGSEDASGTQANSADAQQPQMEQAQQQMTAQAGSRPGQGPASNKPQRPGIAMLRTIQLSVETYQINLLTPLPKSGDLVKQGTPVNTNESPKVWMPTLVQTLKNHAESWGIAGDGMYWKPSLVLRVAPNATGQAEQLAAYLKQSGIEVRQVEVANLPGGSDATRR